MSASSARSSRISWGATLALMAAMAGGVRAQDAQPVGHVVQIVGQADRLSPGSTASAPLATASAVFLGDTLATHAGSRLKILLTDDSVLSLGEETRLRIDEHVYDPAAHTRSSLLRLLEGTLTSIVTKIQSLTSNFRVQTDTAIIGVRGTIFVVNAGPAGGLGPPGGGTQVLVLEGTVEVLNPQLGPAGEVVLTGGQGTWVLPGNDPQPPQPIPQPVLDQWRQQIEANEGGSEGVGSSAGEGTLPLGGEGNALDRLGTGTLGGTVPGGPAGSSVPPIPQEPPPPPTGTLRVSPRFHQRNN